MSVIKLSNLIAENENFLCVGLDPDVEKIPDYFTKDAIGVLGFLEEIIQSTKAHCIAYKINFAFFEALGSNGWKTLEAVRKLLPASHFLIADAKRGDIGNTAQKYAEAIFGILDFDAVTLSPYMGRDVVMPFLEFENKTSILLGLTSNTGSEDFQLLTLQNEEYVFEYVLRISAAWGSPENLMFVIGATKPKYFYQVRKHIPDHYLLVPGIGAQGGNLQDVYEAGATEDVGLLVNSSRGILYAGSDRNFNSAAESKAKQLSSEMKRLIHQNKMK